MKVTFIAPHAGLSGGIRVIAQHATGLAARGHQVLVISQPLPERTLSERVRLALRGKFVSATPPKEASHLDGAPIEHRVLDRPRAVVDADVPDGDVVIATWWETAEWVAKLSRKKGAKAYLIQGDETVFYAGGSDQNRVKATWKLPLMKMAVSGWLVDVAKERSPGEVVRLVPNAVDTAFFSAPERGKQRIPTVGLISSPFPGKGTAWMLKAFQAARRRTPELRLVAFGDPPAPGVEGWPADCELQVRPPQDRIPRLYSSCDAWLFGSEREGFGLPVLEAMACRTPVIGTGAGAAPELLSPGGGILVKWGDVAGTAEAIGRIVNMTDEQWRGMSETAHRTAAEYSLDKAVDRMEAALRDVASGAWA